MELALYFGPVERWMGCACLELFMSQFKMQHSKKKWRKLHFEVPQAVSVVIVQTVLLPPNKAVAE